MMKKSAMSSSLITVVVGMVLVVAALPAATAEAAWTGFYQGQARNNFSYFSAERNITGSENAGQAPGNGREVVASLWVRSGGQTARSASTVSVSHPRILGQAACGWILSVNGVSQPIGTNTTSLRCSYRS